MATSERFIKRWSGSDVQFLVSAPQRRSGSLEGFQSLLARDRRAWVGRNPKPFGSQPHPVIGIGAQIRSPGSFSYPVTRLGAEPPSRELTRVGEASRDVALLFSR
jgi:hypothetical protein